MFISRLLNNIESFHKTSFVSYLSTKLFKTASEELLAEYENFEFQDEKLFIAVDKFVERYKELIEAIDEVESSPSVELLEEICDDLGLYSLIDRDFKAVVELPYLRTEENKLYLEDFDPADLIKLIEKMYAEVNERYQNSSPIDDYLRYKETDGGVSEIENDFGDNRNIDKKDFMEGGGMSGRSRKSTYDPVAARQRRMDEKNLKDRARKATPAEIAADASLQKGLKLINDAAFRYAKNKENPEWVERNRIAQRKAGLNRVTRIKDLGLDTKTLREMREGERMQTINSRIDELTSMLSNTKDNDMQAKIMEQLKPWQAALKFYSVQHAENKKSVDAYQTMREGRTEEDDYLKGLYTKYENTLNDLRNANREKLGKLEDYKQIQLQIADAVERKNATDKKTFVKVLNDKLKERDDSRYFETVLAPAFAWRDNIKELEKRKIINNLPEMFIPGVQSLVEHGKEITYWMSSYSKDKTKGVVGAAQAIIDFLESKVGSSKTASAFRKKIKTAAAEVDIDQVIAQVDAMGIEDPMVYAKMITKILFDAHKSL